MDWPTAVVECVKYIAIVGGIYGVAWMLRGLFGR